MIVEDVEPRDCGCAVRRPSRTTAEGPRMEVGMDDVLYLAIVAVFFALSWGLVKLCERL